jgi:hypothetical protein
MEYGLDISFIGHLYAPIRTTNNYSGIANFSMSQITTPHAKPLPASCSLATSFNDGDFSASHAHIITV